MTAYWQRRWPAALATASFLLLVAVLLGRAVVETQAMSADTVPLLLGALGTLVAVALMFTGPVICLAAIPALAIVPFLPKLTVMPRVDMTAADAFYIALVVWAVLEFLKGGTRRAGGALRGLPIILFVSAAGLSVAYVAVIDPGTTSESLVSWLRLVQTVSIVFLAATFLRSTRDVKIVFAAIAIAGIVAVTIGASEQLAAGGPGAQGAGRAGGVVGPNTLGLVSGLLVLMAFLGLFGRGFLYRVPLALVGGVGLVTTESVGALVGTAVALTLGLVLMMPRRQPIPGLRAVLAITALVLGIGLAYAVAGIVRPGNVPGNDAFKQGSAWHRVVVGMGGIELAARNPLTGVGWRRSGDQDVLGTPEIASALRSRFPGTKHEFFPDVQRASVHNAYIQVAAEMGLIGLALLLVVLGTLAYDTRRLISRAPPGSDVRRLLWFLAWSVVLIVVWLNDNPLYGGQVETVLLAIIVGAIAGLGRKLVAPRHTPAASSPASPRP